MVDCRRLPGPVTLVERGPQPRFHPGLCMPQATCPRVTAVPPGFLAGPCWLLSKLGEVQDASLRCLWDAVEDVGT